MNGWFAPFRRAVLSCLALAAVSLGLRAQTVPPPLTVPAATPLRSYSQGFREPVRLATDSAGQLYVADPRLGVITIRDESGKLVAVKRGFSRPLGVAVDASGRIFVCEAGRGRVSIFTPGWVPAGALGQGDGEFQMPNHLQITPDGSVYVVDSTANLVKVFGATGVLTLQFGGTGRAAGQFNFPTGLAVTPAGEIFVSDQGNERVQVFDTKGTFLRKFGGPLGMLGSNTTFGRLQGLLSDSQGRLYMADSLRGVVVVVNSTGTILGNIGAFGDDPGQLAGPASLAVDRNNRLIVAAPGNTRVELYGLDAYTDPHILFAHLTVSPAELQRVSRARQSDEDEHEFEHEAEHEADREARPGSGQRGGAARARDARPAQAGPEFAPGRRHLVSVLIKIQGVDPSAILESSLTANGIQPARVPGAYIGDFDGDGNFEFRAWFDRRRLVAIMPDGEAFLVLSGRLSDGRTFEGIADVKVVNRTGGVQ